MFRHLHLRLSSPVWVALIGLALLQYSQARAATSCDSQLVCDPGCRIESSDLALPKEQWLHLCENKSDSSTDSSDARNTKWRPVIRFWRPVKSAPRNSLRQSKNMNRLLMGAK